MNMYWIFSVDYNTTDVNDIVNIHIFNEIT